MISVVEAKSLIKEHTIALIPAKLPLQQAAGKILAEDVCAITDLQWTVMRSYLMNGSRTKN
jgi:molybdopterin molybdotransferase